MPLQLCFYHHNEKTLLMDVSASGKMFTNNMLHFINLAA